MGVVIVGPSGSGKSTVWRILRYISLGKFRENFVDVRGRKPGHAKLENTR